MSTRQLFHLTIAGTVASFTTVFVEFGMTGDWSPVLAGGIGVAAAVLYLLGARALPQPHFLMFFPEKLLQWLREHGKSILVLALSVAILVIAITIWTRDDRPTLEQSVIEQPDTAQSSKEQPTATLPALLGRKNDSSDIGVLIDTSEGLSTIEEVSSNRTYTPRTPSELMDIAANQTKRDALQHKGTWIRIEGSVLDISGITTHYFGGDSRKPYIEIDVKADRTSDDIFPREVSLYVRADNWEEQVARIERGDWLVAEGIVYDVRKRGITIINGEIINVSSPNANTQ